MITLLSYKRTWKGSCSRTFVRSSATPESNFICLILIHFQGFFLLFLLKIIKIKPFLIETAFLESYIICRHNCDSQTFSKFLLTSFILINFCFGNSILSLLIRRLTMATLRTHTSSLPPYTSSFREI